MARLLLFRAIHSFYKATQERVRLWSFADVLDEIVEGDTSNADDVFGISNQPLEHRRTVELGMELRAIDGPADKVERLLFTRVDDAKSSASAGNDVT